MKKLISILTISTLTTSTPAPLLANAPLTSDKRDVRTLTSNSNNDYVSLKEIDGIGKSIFYPAVDSEDNIYFVLRDKLFLLKQGETTPTKIDGIKDNIQSLVIDSKDNLYIGTNKGLYKLSVGSDNPTNFVGVNDNMYSLAVDSKDNIYFIKANMEGTYVLKQGETTPTKINVINAPKWLSIDRKDNIYFGTNTGAFVLKQGETTPTATKGITDKVVLFAVDSKDNVYYVISGSDRFAFVLKQGEITPTKINGISSVTSLYMDNKDNVYFGSVFYNFSILQTALSWVKQQSQFNLVDSTKKMNWTPDPYLLSVDGELNIDIANPNIDKVVFDNVQQPQTSKQWEINVKPETAPRDHILQVMFTLGGKQYTSQITVSMQAKIDPPPIPVQQNLSDLIKTTDLGNIIVINDKTIFTAVNQKNGNVIDDFSQIETSKKDNYSVTLTAKSDSKSYKGSVDVTYNVVPTTTVDLKIDVTPTSSTATVIKDYLGQIDDSNITNPVNTFYYANSESVITMVKRTNSSVITGVVYGCDDKWNKTSHSNPIDPSSGIKLDSSQLATNNGKYVVELSDNLDHTNNVYLQITKDKTIPNYFDTDNGKQFEIWAKANGYDNIRGYSTSKLNKLFDESKNWQKVASDSQFANAVADWFKTNGKLSSKEPLTDEQVVEQLKTQIPSSITIDRVNTSNYDLKKVSFVLNQSQVNPNDKVNIVVKYNDKQSNNFTLQIKDSNTPDNSKKSSLTGWAVGIAVGSLLGALLLGWVLKITLIKKFILEPIRKKKAKAFAIKTEKDIAQMKLDDEEWEAKRRGDK